MHHGLAADKEQVADVVPDGDVDHVLGFLQRDAAALLRVEAIDREVAEIALGVADVGDGELQVTGAAVVQDVPDHPEGAGPRFRHRPGHVLGRRDAGVGGVIGSN